MLKNLFFDLLRCKSITPNEAGCFDIARAALPDFSAQIFSAPQVVAQNIRASNLLLRKDFNPQGSIHFVFGCHADVVAAQSGWDSEPFCPVEKNGRIYARGAADMKSGLAAALYAAKNFRASANPKIASLNVLITSDEEGEGTYGSAYALSKLAENNIFFTHALITEPTCAAVFGDSIKTARRGSIHVKIKFIGTGGHIAYAKNCANPIELAALAICKLAGAQLDSGSEIFEPSKLVISNIFAGTKELNVSPQELEIWANVRNNPQTSEQDVKNFCERAIFELAAVKDGTLRAELAVRTSSLPFFCPSDSSLALSLQAAVNDITGVLPRFNAAGGTSDARHFAAAGALACEFGPCNESIHAPNENVAFSEVAQCAQIYLQTISTLENTCN